MAESSKAVITLSTVNNMDDKTEAVHTFYLNASGNIFIDKKTCQILELGVKYNLVLIRDPKTQKYSLEVRSPFDPHTLSESVLPG